MPKYLIKFQLEDSRYNQPNTIEYQLVKAENYEDAVLVLRQHYSKKNLEIFYTENRTLE